MVTASAFPAYFASGIAAGEPNARVVEDHLKGWDLLKTHFGTNFSRRTCEDQRHGDLHPMGGFW
jgi:hypothetical protein